MLDSRSSPASLAASWLGFYEKPEQRLPIASIRLAADVPAGERANIEDMERFITTKRPHLEPMDELVNRIREASRFVPLERLAVSPQCGFSNSVIGNAITPADQERKLRLVVETARRVWGEDTALLSSS